MDVNNSYIVWTDTVSEEQVVQDVELHLKFDVNGGRKIYIKDKKIIYNHITGKKIIW